MPPLVHATRPVGKLERALDPAAYELAIRFALPHRGAKRRLERQRGVNLGLDVCSPSVSCLYSTPHRGPESLAVVLQGPSPPDRPPHLGAIGAVTP